MTAVNSTQQINVGPITIRFLVDAEATAGSAALFEFDVPAGRPVPAAHSHDHYEETLYGLRGTLTWTVDGEVIEVGPGEVLAIPRGVVHRFENRGDDTATQLAVVTPGLLGPAYFQDLAAILSAGGPPDLAAVLDVMRRHGLTPA
jgi:quercetin dioxygenase-like cupin family protein